MDDLIFDNDLYFVNWVKMPAFKLPDVDPKDILDKNKNINYDCLAQNLIKTNMCRCFNGSLFTPFGIYSDDECKSDVSTVLSNLGYTKDTSRIANSVLAMIKNLCYLDKFQPVENMIPFSNGDLYVEKDKWIFKENEFNLVPYRLDVPFSLCKNATPNFDKWLKDLFDEDDIISVQEYLGYCLLPITSLQLALVLIGNGGDGKSVLGHILQRIFGKAFLPVSAKHFFENQFQLSRAENKMICYDDDVTENALASTDRFKKFVVADTLLDVESKGKNGYQIQSYAKFIGCSNQFMESLYDLSDGFYRRFLPIKVKPKENREVILNFGSKVAGEANGIVVWMLLGLKRLMDNNMNIRKSERSEQFYKEIKAESCNIAEFIAECTEKDDNGEESTTRLYSRYCSWCEDNGYEPRKQKTFVRYLKDNADDLGITYTNKIHSDNNSYVRGFKGRVITY